ncbi:Zn-dependent hydrolase/oxidoreductase, partial [Aureobasidium melanogenum]
ARTPFDKSHTLWGSWSVESGGKKIWFGGDTGYRSVPDLPEEVNDYDEKFTYPTCPAFKEIGELRGPFDLGLIPIGAYDPRFIMSPMHANPFDSVNIFIDTQCKKALGIHWGTWVLTEEDVLEPPKLLKQAMAWKDLPETGVFDTCDIGESREY